MPVCATCQKTYSANTKRCPSDGTQLKLSEEEELAFSGTAVGDVAQTAQQPMQVSRAATAPRVVAAGSAMPAGASVDQILEMIDGHQSSDDLAEGTQVGEYMVGGKLGQGGMGVVYHGIQPIIGKKVAIKVLARHLANSSEALRRFVAEARAVNQIGHDNIIDIFSFGSLPDGRGYFVMEYLPGRSLENEIEHRGLLPFHECFDIVSQVTDGLQAAHDAGIVHRDLKPDNIYLVDNKSGGPSVKILDFGVAKLSGPDSELSRTRTGVAMGTPDYMSPEQCRGINVDFRTDIYALGVILYRLFTMQVPFEADSAFEVLAKHLSDPPRKPSEFRKIPLALEDIILKCLAKKPEDRFQSMDALATALAEVAASLPKDIEQAASMEAGVVRRASSDPNDTVKGGPATAQQTHPPAANDTVQQTQIPSAVVAAVTDGPMRVLEPSRSRWPMIVGVLAIVFAGTVTSVFLLKKNRTKAAEATNGPVRDPKTLQPPPQDPTPPPVKVVTPTDPPKPTTGGLQIKTNLRDAVVFVDDVEKGKGNVVDVKDLAPGVYLVKVARDKYGEQMQSLKVEAGQVTAFGFILEKSKGTRTKPAIPGSGAPPDTAGGGTPDPKIKDPDGTIDIFKEKKKPGTAP